MAPAPRPLPLERREDARKKQKEAEAGAGSCQITGSSPSHPLADYAGMYSHPGYGEFEIAVSGDSLFALIPNRKTWFRHFHYDVFEPFEVEKDGSIDTTGGSELRMLFTSNTAGEIAALHMKIEPALNHAIEFKRSPKAVDMEKGELEKYVGEYELMGVISKVYIKEDALYLFVQGQPEYELLPVGEHKFKIKILDGYNLQFHEEENSGINAVSFIQPNGTFKAMRK